MIQIKMNKSSKSSYHVRMHTVELVQKQLSGSMKDDCSAIISTYDCPAIFIQEVNKGKELKLNN